MNRFLTTSLLTLLLLVGGAQVVHAVVGGACSDMNGNVGTINSAGNCVADTNNSNYVAPTDAPADGTSCSDVNGNFGTYQSGTCIADMTDPDYVSPAAAQNEINQASKQPAQKDTSPDSIFGDLMVRIVSLFAWLAGAAMVTLNYATYYTVISMGAYVKGLSAVGVTWTVLRDLGNIMLIFGFLAVGITTIIGVEWYGGGKKMLPMMLVAAVFLNFSLFISEAVIDTGNLFATQFYTQINGGSLPTESTLLNQGISSTIMNKLGLQTIYGDAQDPTKAGGIFKGQSSWIIGFMSIILFIVLAFVLFTLAFVLVARFVVLIFLIILAPIGFAGLAVPMLKKRADQWWDKLFEQTVTAPILFLLLYIALRVITEMGRYGASPDWTGYVGTYNIPGLASALLTFMVTMGLLLLVVIQAKNLSAAGASGATKLAGKLSFGAVGWAGSRTIGRGAYYAGRGLRQSKLFNKFDAVTGRAVSRTLDRTATGSFDVRGTGALKNMPGGGIDAGEVAKDGFVGARKRNIEDHENAVKAIEVAHKEAPLSEKEQAKIAETTATLKEVTTAHGIVEKEKKDAGEVVVKNKTEVTRLEAEEQRRVKFGVNNTPKEQRELDDARQNLAASEQRLANAVGALKVSTESLTNAENEVKEAKGAPGERLKANKRAYAEGIENPLNPINFFAYGPDSGGAARKIKDSLKEKTDDEKLLEQLKKAIKPEEKKSEAAPASIPPTPPTGGGASPAGHP